MSIIHMVIIATMLNFNGGNNGHGLKNVTCKQTFSETDTAKHPTLVTFYK